jgi:hypothetical protein
MTVEARELYSSSMGPMVSGSRTPFRANAHRARAERSLWRRDGGVGRGILACLRGSRGEKLPAARAAAKSSLISN